MNTSLTEAKRIWEKAKEKIKKILSNDKMVYESFFENTELYNIDNNTMTISTDTSLASRLLNTKYITMINDAVSEISETVFKIEFVYIDELKEKETKENSKKDKIESTYFPYAKLNSKLTFSNFVVGPFNREASQAALIIASNPGKMYNPLFIHSESGLGKTHLLHAIGNFILENGRPDANILYITANDFVEEYIKYVRADKDSESLKDFFKDVDVLLFDDVQFLVNKVKTEEMFFYIYQRLVQEGKQIVITSDRQPNELKDLESRLVTRFNQGLVVSIKQPDEMSCVEILKKKIEANGQNVDSFDNSVLHFFATKFSQNVRELEGALNRLIFYVVNFKQTNHVTLEIAVEAVSSLTGSKSISTELSEQKIIDVVSDYYNLTPSQLVGKNRNNQIATARHIAMYLIRDMIPDESLKKIGTIFGGRDHTTVMNGVQKVEKELKHNEALKTAISDLKKRIKQ
ncbi:MAG: chromosomal replication initiator protein DnaA [Bacilli bacterium]